LAKMVIRRGGPKTGGEREKEKKKPPSFQRKAGKPSPEGKCKKCKETPKTSDPALARHQEKRMFSLLEKEKKQLHKKRSSRPQK